MEGLKSCLYFDSQTNKMCLINRADAKKWT